MTADYHHAPIDTSSEKRLAAQGLRLALVDTANTAAFTAWLEAEARGFHGSRPTDGELANGLSGVAYRRSTGVWDDSAAEPESPISTVSSWPTQLTVPGKRSVSAWAISAVTVAPTHRRRGIARAMLEAELRTAHRLGAAVAILTVSEATIYSRYGFAPTAMTANWQINTNRAKWIGPATSGRLQFVSLEQLRDEGPALVERVRLTVPGQIEFSGHLWERLLGFDGGAGEDARKLRAVRYDDNEGVSQGFAIYKVTESGANFEAHVLDLQYLVAATDDAYAALWRYLLEIDLVAEIRAPLRPIVEPFTWQVSDFRAAYKTLERDHLWARILDVTAALEARIYNGPGRIELTITDPLGFAQKHVLLTVDSSGTGVVTQLVSTDSESVDVAETALAQAGATASVSLTVNELGALYLGGVSGVALVRAGRITENQAGSAAVLDSLFHSAVSPWLSIWF